MRRDYGSRLFELIDQPANPAQRLLALATVADALRRWEPRLLLRRLGLRPAADAAGEAQQGRFEISIEGVLRTEGTPSAEPLSLSVPLTLEAVA
jgi:phage baseplate assembly protein W